MTDPDIPCTCGHRKSDHGSERYPDACRFCDCPEYTEDDSFMEVEDDD